MNKQSLMHLLDRPIAYHRCFARVAGSVNAGVLLSQAVYWSGRTPDGWFWKTNAEWNDETMLTDDEQRTARKKLSGILIVEKRGLPAKNYYKVDFDKLFDELDKLRSQVVDNPDHWTETFPTTGSGQSQPLVVDNQDDIYTETTTENTSETTTENIARKARKKSRESFLAVKPDEVAEDTWKQFQHLRSKRRSPVTTIALEAIAEEAKAAGVTLDYALRRCIIKGWQNFEATFKYAKSTRRPPPDDFAKKDYDSDAGLL